VSLRDGIQSANPEKYTTVYKQSVLHDILFEERPTKIEMGSIVSAKILPIMSDSIEMYHYATQNADKYYTNPPAFYLLVPNLQRLKIATENRVPNISFITSVSNTFQLKNTNKTIDETKQELNSMLIFLRDMPYYETMNRKLYISCITECPLIGKQSIDYICGEIREYHENYDFTELCLSDTCGTLTPTDFVQIAKQCIMNYNIPVSKISLHLHVNESRQHVIKQIIKHALTVGINKFDVSLLETGGCSVTMSPGQLAQNISYDFFYECLLEYIDQGTPSW